MTKLKILILGSTGFVGRSIKERLALEGIPFVSSSKSEGHDLRDYRKTVELIASVSPDVIVNCAAHVGSLNYVTEHAADVILDNSRMILNLYEAVAASDKSSVIINPIANCGYPAKAETYIEDQWWDGHLHRSVLSYGSTRRLLWSVGESFSMQYGMRSLYLLVPNMYGPFDSTDPNKAHALNALISKFVKADVEKQSEVEIWGTGVAIREWLYAKDFARIITEIIKDINMVDLAEPINVAQNFGLSVKELALLISNHFDNKFSIKWITSMPEGAPKKVMGDTKFRKVFKDFRFTPLQDGIATTIEYYQSIYPY